MALNVLDVSGWQKGIATSVLNQSDEILIIKVTEGAAVLNDDWRRQADFAISQGMLVGLYHFATYGYSSEHAQHFFEVTKDYWGKGVAIPILDFENSTGNENMVSYTGYAYDFLQLIETLTGARPWIYTGAEVAKSLPASIKKYALWVAAYPYSTINKGFGTSVAWEWARDNQGGGLNGWTVLGWQYTGTGRLDGYAGDLDMSYFYATRAELDTYAHGSDIKPVGSMVYPVNGKISQAFNGGQGLATNLGNGHTGIDWACATGTEVRAAADGVVLWSDWAANLPQTSWADRWFLMGGGFAGLEFDSGITLVIDHGDYISISAHLIDSPLNVGDRVKCGQVVAKSGYTGYTIGGGVAGLANVYGAHLHFEILTKPFNWNNGFFGRVDPAAFIDARKKDEITNVLEFIMSMSQDEASKLIEKAVSNALNAPVDRAEVGGKTSTTLETKWAAANSKAVRADVIAAQREISKLNETVGKQSKQIEQLATLMQQILQGGQVTVNAATDATVVTEAMREVLKNTTLKASA